MNIERWRQLAMAIARKHPKRDPYQIAWEIQQSSEGKRRSGVLSYSITTIMWMLYPSIKSIRDHATNRGEGDRSEENRPTSF